MQKSNLGSQSVQVSHPNPFNPSQFDDQVAMQIEWTPLIEGGTSFQTLRLVEKDINRMEFKSTLNAKLVYLIITLLGLMVAVVFSINSSGRIFGPVMIIPVLAGVIFTIVGVISFYTGTVPIVFDKIKGYYWKGRTVPDGASDKSTMKNFARLSDIHALQLVSEYCTGGRNPFYSYELNLILNSGSRINVVDHGNLAKLREDAQTLSKFLGKPVWDSIIIVDNDS